MGDRTSANLDEHTKTFGRDTGVRERAVFIPAGSFYIVVYFPNRPEEYAGRWMGSAKSRRELKTAAENLPSKRLSGSLSKLKW